MNRQQYYIVNKWDTDSDQISHSDLYLFNSIEEALVHYNHLIRRCKDLNDSKKEEYNFISRSDYNLNKYSKINSKLCEDWDEDFPELLSGMYIADINEVKNDVLVYRERRTYGGWKRFCGVSLMLLERDDKTPENCLGRIINMSIP